MKKGKNIFAVILVIGMIMSLMACGGGSKKGTSDDSRETSEKGNETTGTSENEPVTITFWHRDGNVTSNPIYGEIIKKFQDKYPWITVEYTGLASDSYMQKFNNSVVTGTSPDVGTISDKDLYALVAQDALLSLDDAFEQWEEKDQILEEIIELARFYARDEKLYILGYGKTQETSWYNAAWHKENNIEAPTTISQLVEYCKTYADKDSGKYYFSLRGGSGSAENLFMFILSYAGIPTFFTDDGISTLDNQKVIEGLDVYVNLYKDGLVSQDAISNDYREMVAEFGSGTAQYIMHNSSSVSEHEKNLGTGNFMPVQPLAGEDGIAVCKSPTFMGAVVFKDGEHKEEAILFAQYLASAEGAGYVDNNEGRVPVNTGVYEQEWYAENPYFATYAGYADKGVQFARFPIWLDGYTEYAKTNITADLQAVMMGEKTSEEVCKAWAEALTAMQQEYLSNN